MTDDLSVLLRKSPDAIAPDEIRKLVARGADLAPALAGIVKDPASWADAAASGWAAIHAWLLLGSIRAPGTLDVLVRSLDHAYAHDLDFVTDAAPNVLDFRFDSITNLHDAHGHYMGGAMRLTIKDQDNITEEWFSLADGKTQPATVFTLTRRR